MRRLALALLLLAIAPAAAHAQAGVSYQIPPDNPFAGTAGAAPEVYAYGLRNPFRFSFDRQTGDLVIGDVGGGAREEVDWIAARAAVGANFGWPCREGSLAGPDPGRCPAGTAFVEPLFEYANTASPVTGGYVVRDPALTGLVGRALYADFNDGAIRSLRLTPGAPDDQGTGASVASLAGFGEDAAGRLYAANLFGNQVVRLTAGGGSGTLATQPVAGPWDGPIAIAPNPADSSRLFVAEREGRVRIVSGGAALAGSFLNIASDVRTDSERGMLSVVAAPDYAASGLIYVYYTNSDGDIVIAEYARSPGNPNVADPATRRVLLTIEHSSEGNHNGGTLHFGPDGCLWASTGDGGGQGDIHQNAQSIATHLGKLLRIDPDPPGRGGAVCQFPAGPTNPGPTADTTPPVMRVRVPRRQRVPRNRGAIVYARCNEACRVGVGARLRIGRRSYRLKSTRRPAAAGKRVRLKARLTRRSRRALKRALRRGRRPTVRVALRATDLAGNRSPFKRARVRVRR